MADHELEQSAYRQYRKQIDYISTALRLETDIEVLGRVLVDCQATKGSLDRDRRLGLAPDIIRRNLHLEFSHLENALYGRINPQIPTSTQSSSF